MPDLTGLSKEDIKKIGESIAKELGLFNYAVDITMTKENSEILTGKIIDIAYKRVTESKKRYEESGLPFKEENDFRKKHIENA
jgi:hypothetical protein